MERKNNENPATAPEDRPGMLEDGFLDIRIPVDSSVTIQQTWENPSGIGIHLTETHEGDKYVEDLVGFIRDTISTSDIPIVVHGPSGIGKTCLMRKLASVLLKKKEEQPASGPDILQFIEFKNMPRGEGDDSGCSMKRLFPFIQADDELFGKSVVLILDGLDECGLSSQDADLLKGNIRHLFQMVSEVNERQDTRFNLVLSGETHFIESLNYAFPVDQYVLEIEPFDPEKSRRWVERYARLKGIEDPLAELEALDELIPEDFLTHPFTLSLVSVLGFNKNAKARMVEQNKGKIGKGHLLGFYFDSFVEKAAPLFEEQSPFSNPSKLQDFIDSIGYIFFRFKIDRISPDELIERLRSENRFLNKSWLMQVEDEKIRKAIEVCTDQFLFETAPDGSISFVHKILRNYLAMRGLVECVREAVQTGTGEQEKHDGMIAMLYYLLGGAKLCPVDQVNCLLEIIICENILGQDEFRVLGDIFRKAEQHVFLWKQGNHADVNPIELQANFLAGLFHILKALGKKLTRDIPKENAKKRFVFFETNDGLYKFISLMNAADIEGFVKRNFDFSEMNLGGADLVRADLSATRLFGSDLSDADLSGADLSYADIRNVDLSRSILTEADISNADLSHSDLSAADLSGADLSGATILNADLSDAYLFEADLSGAKLMNSDLSGAFLENADLSHADLKNADLSDANLSGADLSDADLTNTDLSRADLTSADLSGTKLDGADLDGAIPDGISKGRTPEV